MRSTSRRLSASAERSLLDVGLAPRQRVLAPLQIGAALGQSGLQRGGRGGVAFGGRRAGLALWVRPYRTAAITIPTAMSAAAPMISMVVSSRGSARPDPFTAFDDLRASDRPVRDARVMPGSDGAV